MARIHGGPPDPTTSGSPFVLGIVSGVAIHVEGICGYFNVEGSTIIEGMESSDGRFWPQVTAQVANDPEGVWKVVGASKNAGAPTKLNVGPRDSDARLYVDLDLFRPQIGQYRYGRMVLASGISATFELKDLLP